MGGWKKWWYHDAEGAPVFQHLRIPRKATPDNPRTKGCPYRYPVAFTDGKVAKWKWGKPCGADDLIYRLPLVLAHPDDLLILTEGESDATAALDQGVLASCHHQAAGHMTEAQAQSLAGHRGRIVLVADNDVAGASCVVRRYDLLRGVGIPAKRLRVREVAPRHPGADLRDHLEAGYRFRDLVHADLDQLRELAATSTGDPSEGSWPWVTPEEREQIRTWRSRVEVVPAKGA